MHRRDFLKLIVPATVGLAAGCSGSSIDELLTTDGQRVEEVIRLIHTHPNSEGTDYRVENGITTVNLQSGPFRKRVMISDDALQIDSWGYSHYTFYDEGLDGRLEAASLNDPNVGEVAMTPENTSHFQKEYQRELENLKVFYENALPKHATPLPPTRYA